jgi:carbamoyl-phosphate synthase/aspartate carbamoyltransferase/dihydroorotase
VTVHTLPGLVDVHVHLRHPGGTHKESIGSGTAAALAGGVTTVLAMPNTRPPVVDRAGLAASRARHAAEAYCDVGLYLGATADNAASAAAAAPLACGLKIYVNETYGDLRVEDLATLDAHFGAWPAARPLVLHAEGQAVAAAIGLAAAHGRPVHIAHVSRAEEIRLIARAKAAGLPVSCEVTPHHLFLTAADLADLGPFGHVRPALGSAADRDALWDHLDAVDCIATDHAPHTRAEKQGAEPPPGLPGLETLLPLMLTAVAEGRLSLDRLVALTSQGPARLAGLPEASAGEVEVEIGPAWTLPERGWQSRADWSPFAGRRVLGRVRRTLLRGALAWDGQRVGVAPGTGRLFPPSTAAEERT